MIKGKSPEEIRKTFNIKNDFTPAEEEQVRKQLTAFMFCFRYSGLLLKVETDCPSMLFLVNPRKQSY